MQAHSQVTVRTFTVLPTRSGVLRAVSERKILDLFSSRLAAISLSGYIFFGSSVSISDQVRLWAPPLNILAAHACGAQMTVIVHSVDHVHAHALKVPVALSEAITIGDARRRCSDISS